MSLKLKPGTQHKNTVEDFNFHFFSNPSSMDISDTHYFFMQILEQRTMEFFNSVFLKVPFS